MGWRGCIALALLAGCGGTAVIDGEDGPAGVGGADSGEDCPELSGAPEAPVGWRLVMEVLVSADGGNCASSGCHGDERSAANGVYLPLADPDAVYKTLTTVVDAAGRHYVDADRPAASWIQCHVGGHAPGLRAPDIALIIDWLRSGAPGP